LPFIAHSGAAFLPHLVDVSIQLVWSLAIWGFCNYKEVTRQSLSVSKVCVEFYKSLFVMFCKKGEADIVVQICGGVLLTGVEFCKLCGNLSV